MHPAVGRGMATSNWPVAGPPFNKCFLSRLRGRTRPPTRLTAGISAGARSLPTAAGSSTTKAPWTLRRNLLQRQAVWIPRSRLYSGRLVLGGQPSGSLPFVSRPGAISSGDPDQRCTSVAIVFHDVRTH